MLQDGVKYAILMPHGVDPFRVRNVARRSENRRINAMRLVYQNSTGQPWVKPGNDDAEFGGVILGIRWLAA
jgi:hypothetical protein